MNIIKRFVNWLRFKSTGRVRIYVDITNDVKTLEMARAASKIVDMTSEEAFAEVIQGLKKPYPSIEVSGHFGSSYDH